MWEDPIVAEIHRHREKMAADVNYDVTAFFAGLRKRQSSLGARLIPQTTHAEAIVDSENAVPANSADSMSSDAVPTA